MMITSHIRGVGNRRFAFGLRWSTGVRAEGTAAAKADNAPLICVRPRARQYGLAYPDGGMKPGLLQPWHSAAAAIAEGARGTVLGAWPFADGRCWVIAIGPEGILPDGDTMFDDEASARARLSELTGAAGPGHWRTIYAPGDWGIPDARHDALQKLLERSPGPRLQPVAQGHPLLVGVLPKIAVGAGAFGLLVFFGPGFEEQAPAPLPAPTAAAPLPPEAPVLTWTEAAESLAACLPEMFAPHIPGWEVTAARCAGGSVTHSLRATAPLPLRSLVTYAPSAQPSADGTTATLTVPVAQAPVRRHSGPFPNWLAVRRYLTGSAEVVGSRAEVVPPAPPPPPLPGEAPPPPPLWIAAGYTLTSSAPPAVWAPLLQRLPTATVDELTLSASHTWTVKGVIYATNH